MSDDAIEAPAAEVASAETKARAAGRGGLAVLGAKGFFIVVSFAQQLLLKRVLGGAGYGALSRVLVFANVANNVVVASSIQGVSRAVSHAGERDETVFRSTLRVHLTIAVILALVFAAVAPAIAAFEHAEYILWPVALNAVVLFMYATYAPLVGALNGRGQFTKQAALDVTFATMRTAGMVGVGWLFIRERASGVLGAMLGFALAAACIVPLALRWSGTGRASSGEAADGPRPMTYLIALAPLALAQLTINLVMQADIAFLGRFLSERAVIEIGTADAAARADEWVTVYRASQLFAFLPYQLVMSVTQVLFPMVARAHAAGDRESVRAYTQRGARIAALLAGLFVAVVAVLPASLLRFAYDATVASRGADVLTILALGQVLFTMMGVAATVLASIGRERKSTQIMLETFAVIVLASIVFVRPAAFGHAQVLAAAIATTVALAYGLARSIAVVFAATGAFAPAITLIRVGAILAVFGVASRFIPAVPILLVPIAAGLIAIAYVVALAVTREIGAADLTLLRNVIAQRRGKS